MTTSLASEPTTSGPSHPALDAYAALPVEPGSLLDQELQQAVAQEHLQENGVSLTDDLTHEPADLTPAMRSWFSTHIAPIRLRALAELKAAFEADQVGKGGVRGALFESELDHLKQTRVQKQQQAASEFWRRHGGLVGKRDDARRGYETERAAEGRAPAEWRFAGHFFAIAGIVLVEFGLNYESFSHVPAFSTPLLALAATAVAAILLGVGGYIHGTLLKQWNYYFGPHDRTRTFQGVRMASLGLGLAAAALGAVAYARYSLIAPAIERANIMGVAPPSLFWSLSGSVMLNVGMYALSIVAAYFGHDRNPDLVGLHKSFQAMDLQVQQARRGLVREYSTIEEAFQQNAKKAHVFDEASKSAPNYAANKAQLARFQAQDARVVGTLGRYRASLVRSWRGLRPEPVLRRSVLDQEDGARIVTLKPGEWLALPIELKMISAGGGHS